MAFITKGITLYHNGVAGGPEISFEGKGTKNESFGYAIPGLQEVGELTAGSASSGGFDKIEVTTLADSKHEYVNGLIADEGDASAITFTLLFNPSLYDGFLDVIKAERSASPAYAGIGSTYNVIIPSGGVFEITGMSSIKVNSSAVNAAMTMVLTVTPTAEIEFNYSTSV